MITCKFTKEELNLIQMGLKYLGNYGLETAKNIMSKNATLYDEYIKRIEDFSKEDSDVLNTIVELRGNVKSLIRNN